ncbi:hypothetical protein LX15_000169 [Streptoalloteichus tenebrarius]|uniref:Uncharacterized protein n=1 Tax=Streptoalloteichus tenebrarius (strain ATCC 17920 / DSM 40477 / JCM 4838 / CBS 697.72 / NBRC 16177 / NCIMB 11028 / NRRL B-12390 / A12253. 1 / ISP 5477) TaxID=1933 RepID=A0ABT1HLU1_STRSD|nr:hypothetical protein [Streptoalloteichus tenebrarius]MCP2256486.1 hypothetical protein [Streptoalloteichus tenebrarius]BFF04838.1 hypothetical protein GCM10020241_65130 [Streptoalloteichus tenebrarius]
MVDDDVGGPLQRNEVVLRSFALWTVDPGQAQDFLREELEYHRETE